MRTLQSVLTLAPDTTVLDYLDQQVTVPVTGGVQAQGDVLVVPDTLAPNSSRFQLDPAAPVPAAGVPVVRGEAMGNTHLLISDGPCSWQQAHPASPEDVLLGIVTVEPGSTAYLIHPEHGATGIAPGTYQVRRQRQQADVIAYVAD